MKPITERHVQAIWYDAALRPTNLRTRRGSEVRVVSPGEWNLGAGPDFRNAVLEVGKDRRRVVGDIEIHLCPNDWDFHRHGADPNYRNVIAHVTWGCGPVPGSLPPCALSIWLGRFVTANASFAPEQIDLMAYPYARLPSGVRPCEEKIGHDPDLAGRVLAEAGRHRLRMKARRMSGRLCAAQNREQVFYEEVMTALAVRGAKPSGHSPRLHEKTMPSRFRKHLSRQVGIMPDPFLARPHAGRETRIRIRHQVDLLRGECRVGRNKPPEPNRERPGWKRSRHGTAPPGHMRNHITVIRIRSMTMEIPIRRGEMDLYIPNDSPSFLANLKNGVAEVRPGLEVPFPRAHHADLTAATRRQDLRPQGRVVPDRLDMPFGYWLHYGSFLIRGRVRTLDLRRKT